MLWTMLSQPLRAPHARQQLQKQTDFDAVIVDDFLLGKTRCGLLRTLKLVSASAEKAHTHRAELAVAAQ